MNKKLVLFVFITILLISSDANAQTIDVSCNPSLAGTGATISVPVSISGNTNEIEAFGAYLTFNTGFFSTRARSRGI